MFSGVLLLVLEFEKLQDLLFPRSKFFVNPNNDLKLRIEPQTLIPPRGTVWFRLLSGKEVEWGLRDFARSSSLRDSPYIDPTKMYTMARRFWYFLKHLYRVEITVL